MTYTKWMLIILGISLTAFVSAEYLINTISAAASLRLKSVPGMVALTIFILLYSTFVFFTRPKLLSSLFFLITGLVLLVFIGFWVWLFIGCSTGPVCIWANIYLALHSSTTNKNLPLIFQNVVISTCVTRRRYSLASHPFRSYVSFISR